MKEYTQKQKEQFREVNKPILSFISARITLKILKKVENSELANNLLNLFEEEPKLTVSKMLDHINISRNNLYKHLERLEAIELISKSKNNSRRPGNENIYTRTTQTIANLKEENNISFFEESKIGVEFLKDIDTILIKSVCLRI